MRVQWRRLALQRVEPHHVSRLAHAAAILINESITKSDESPSSLTSTEKTHCTSYRLGISFLSAISSLDSLVVLLCFPFLLFFFSSGGGGVAIRGVESINRLIEKSTFGGFFKIESRSYKIDFFRLFFDFFWKPSSQFGPKK